MTDSCAEDSSGEADLAAAVIADYGSAGMTVATAESLTGGLIAARLTAVPGASSVFRAGLVTYATDTKAGLLGVPEDLLARRGPVDREVARIMATAVRGLAAADVAVATTGVAGPDPQGDAPVGRVFVALVWEGGDDVRQLELAGTRAQIREEVVDIALKMLLEAAVARRG